MFSPIQKVFTILFVLSVQLPGSASAESILPGYLTFRGPFGKTPLAPEVWAYCTRRNALILRARKGQSIILHFKTLTRWGRGGDAAFFLQDDNWNTIATGMIPDAQKKNFRIVAPKGGTYRLQINAGVTACSVSSSVQAIQYEASKDSPFNAYPPNGRMYFYVSSGTMQFSIFTRSNVPAKASATVYRPDGKVFSRLSLLKSGYNEIRIAADKPFRGKIWSMKLTGPATRETYTYLKGISPYVSQSPGRLFVPFVDIACSAAGRDTILTCRFNVDSVEIPEIGRVRLTLKNNKGETVGVEERSDMSKPIRFRVPDKPVPCIYDVVAEFFSADHIAYRFKKRIAISHHRKFVRIDRALPGKLPEISPEQENRGYLIFSRDEPGSIYPTSIPGSKEIVNRLAMDAAPGEIESFAFAVHALKDMKKVTYKVSDFVALTKNHGSIPARCVDMRVARYWPQRIEFFSEAYHVIPEILDPVHPVDIKKGTSQMFYARVTVPADAQAGEYRAAVTVTSNNRHDKVLGVCLTVLPFTLRTPQKISWLLAVTANTSVWGRKNYPRQRIRQELQAVRKVGINRLVVYPHFELKNVNGKPVILWGNSDKWMSLYKELGFKEPFVWPIYGAIDQYVQKYCPNALTANRRGYSREAEKLYRKILGLMADEVRKRNWPTYILHTVDEPGYTAEGINKFIRTASVIKKAGYKTFTTCGHWYIDKIDNVLDYRAYSLIGYASLPNARKAAEIYEHTRKSGDVFWLYGGGCYANDGVLHEGIIVANRYQNGVFLWRSRATGIENWIAYWPMGSKKVDDFDKSKDACTYYLSDDPVAKPLLPTLQWEGIREGIDDYRYLYTLETRIRDILAEHDHPLRAKAVAIRAKLKKTLSSMPWRHARGEEYPPHTITNGNLDALRKQVIEWIIQLKP